MKGMPTTQSGRTIGRVSPTPSITSPDPVPRQTNQHFQGTNLDLDQSLVEDTYEGSSTSPHMADQQQTNVGQMGTGRQGEEASGEQITTNVVQLEMLKALKEAREGQWMMITMMSDMWRQHEEMENFRQQLMQIPTFKAMFPESSQVERAGVDVNKENQNVPLATESLPIPIIHL